MGEVVRTIDSSVKVLDEHSILIEALKLMTLEQELGKGGNREQQHFSWLNSTEPDNWHTGFDALNGWRFPVAMEEEDVWTEFVFRSEKVGQEELLFNRIEPYMEGYVEMTTDYDRTIQYDFSQ